MLGAPKFVPVNPIDAIKSAFQCAKIGYWTGVFTRMSQYPNLAYTTDNLVESGLGWTLMDYAVYQGNLNVIKKLRKQYNDMMCLNGTVVLHIVHQQNWQWIMQLLKEHALSVHVFYIVPGMANFTLLDLANNQGKTHIANDLRNTYQARTFEQIQEYLERQALFQAAHRKDWQTVYAMLDKDRGSVDGVDVWFNKDWVLLQYAFAQQDQEAIVKLLDHYSASLDEIRNTDYLLYDCIVSFYEMAKHASFARDLTNLTTAFEQHTITRDKLNFGPIARPILSGFNLGIPPIQDDDIGETGLQCLERDFPSKEKKSVTFFSKS